MAKKPEKSLPVKRADPPRKRESGTGKSDLPIKPAKPQLDPNSKRKV